MYLALALSKQFVLNATRGLRIQWTWKCCLNYAIGNMNNVGVEFYSSFATLSRWHRKFLLLAIGINFAKYQMLRQSVPTPLLTILMQWKAFKNHGRVANI